MIRASAACTVAASASRRGLARRFRWSAVSGATRYILKWGTSAGVYTGERDVGNVTSYPLSNLPFDAGTTYYMACFPANGPTPSDVQATGNNEIQVLDGARIA